MQWNKIKLTFILAFLVLNVYLVIQLFPQEETEQIGLETETPASVLESVKGYSELSDEETETNQQYEATKMQFKKKELEELPGNMNFDINSGTELVATFEEPERLPVELPFDKDTTQSLDALNGFIEEYVLHGEDYTYWGRQGNKMLFFQETDKGQTYFSEDSLLMVTINEDYQVTGYTQTYIENFKKSENEKGWEVNHYSEKQAVKALTAKQYIERGDTIEVEKGFYPIIELSSKPNYTPAYKITVNDTKHYFYLMLPDNNPYIRQQTESAFISNLDLEKETETEDTQ
ncbi:Two-component signal transduction system YycFG, regulatory protein YycI [Terribacillus aidingensis]|uniref:Two-component signal transduction system YycFG, regulatory protein YycI n=1 Tax=Terribacillus aidingensis TaxID=586416 RepID=A0A285MYQ9_9BACI|nr:two-component system regulatory protein YycI [Terribacillus aidingensis]SNZ02324.1 Two-component signal transduction system YycFG, regulatory protein YycI [Terribacillus aidingensis]